MAHRENILKQLARDAVQEEEYLAEFMPPSGFTPPDDAKDGRDFETMVTARMKPDGSLCIKSIGGVAADRDGTEEVAMEETEEEMMPPSQRQGMPMI